MGKMKELFIERNELIASFDMYEDYIYHILFDMNKDHLGCLSGVMSVLDITEEEYNQVREELV